jgi:hypothetical protein
MKQNINKVLLNHFSSGGSAATYLRMLIPDITEQMDALFLTRSDIERVKLAEKLAEKILSITEFSDLVPLRSVVATLEIKRLINYDKQTDHTVHTVYLFLLGIWVYDNIVVLRNEINSSIDSSNPIKMFIFQWIFASLLHDVGYLFYDYRDSKNKIYWKKFDEMLQGDFILNYLSKRIMKNGEELKKLYTEFINQYDKALSHSDCSDVEQLLQQMNNIPWVNYIMENEKSCLELLLSSYDEDKELMGFASYIATKGYPYSQKEKEKIEDTDKDKPELDHAIASGLMLLKYTSIWYWIYKKAEDENEDLYQELNDGYKYPKEVFKKHVLPACRAVIYHSIPNRICNHNNEPLLYLSILCDELQMWDRFWSGNKYIENWIDIEHCMAEQIYADIGYNELGEHQLHFALSEEKYESLSKKMDERLESWEKFIKLTKIN